ncbi:hypothetical protein ALP75_202403 [Pseudomonas syringae pv. actinidiae]|nr:hypothetical protein ALP75_202403 [Pseudomonas syringae pv. actinidiae]
MGDPDQRGALFAHQFLHFAENLRLNGHVQRGGRLVGDNQVRGVQQRNGNRHPLAHAAGQFVRVLPGAQHGLVQTDLLEQFQHIGIDCRIAAAIGQNQRFGNLPTDAQGRVEADHRVLRHQTDHTAANPTFLALGGVTKVVTIDLQFAAGDARVVRQQAEDRVGQGRLAGAGFADNRHGFAAGHLE